MVCGATVKQPDDALEEGGSEGEEEAVYLQEHGEPPLHEADADVC